MRGRSEKGRVVLKEFWRENALGGRGIPSYISCFVGEEVEAEVEYVYVDVDVDAIKDGDEVGGSVAAVVVVVFMVAVVKAGEDGAVTAAASSIFVVGFVL